MKNSVLLNRNLTLKLNGLLLIACRIVAYIVDFNRNFLTLGNNLLRLVLNLREGGLNRIVLTLSNGELILLLPQFDL